jgi:hypothetical protein
MALEERKGPIDLAFLGSRRRWHGDPSVLIMKYLAALIAFCCINLKTAKALGLAALAAGERRRSDRVRTSSAAVHESGNVKVFGCRPGGEGATNSGAGVGKPPREETARD